MFLTLVTLLFLVSGQCSLCHLKTYNVPCNPEKYCSHIEVFISANGIENSECLLNVTLIAYNMHSSLPRSVGFSFNRQNKILDHICTKFKFGGTSAKIYTGSEAYKTGSSIYMNGNLICTWIAQPFAVNQSPYDIESLDLVYNTNYSLVLRLDRVDLIVAKDSSELPWHQLGYFECGGYKIYGNNEYRLRIKKETKEVQLWQRPSNEPSNIVEVFLTHRSKTSLVILCNYFERVSYAFIENSDKTRFLIRYYKFDDTCSMVLPDTFKCEDGLCSVLNSNFDLQIKSDNKLIYSFHNLNFNGSNSGSTSLVAGSTIIYPEMMPIIVISLFLVNFIESTNGYDPCSSKVYKLSYGSTDNLLVEAQISVIEHDNIWDHHLNVTLIGHNVPERAIRRIGLAFTKGDQYFTYFCTKLQTGLTEASTLQNGLTEIKGSSIYLPNKLVCWWITDSAKSWPSINGREMDLINDCDYRIILTSDKTNALVASNAEDIPICRRKYTKCSGNGNYGNSNYSLVIRPNEHSIAFYLQVLNDDPPAVTEVKFTSLEGTRISIICNHTQYNVFGYISDNFDSTSVPSSQLEITTISDIECGWKLPRSITFSSKSYEIGKIEGELSIIADGSIVYQENNVKLKYLTTKKSTNLLIIILPIGLILILIIMILFVLYRKQFFHHIFNSFLSVR
uniref:CUB domain-containing protein n=1 Tax=Tetranychus urticae TaxID=32264 RepID=T1KU74_TETUR